MKTTFKLIFLTLALAFTATTISAQSQDRPRAQMQDRSERGDRADRSPEEIAKQQTKRMTKALELTEAQQEKIHAINLEYAMKMAELREGTREEREQMRAQVKEVREGQDADIKSVLTPEQAATLDAKKAAMKDKMEERRGNRRGGGRRGGK